MGGPLRWAEDCREVLVSEDLGPTPKETTGQVGVEPMLDENRPGRHGACAGSGEACRAGTPELLLRVS